LAQALHDVQPDYVVNCIGVLIKGSQSNVANAIYINAYFPHLLAKLIDENTDKGRLIHISTDCVFSGSKGMYKDSDIKDALDTYGMTKNLGELINDNSLTVRTSIIGPELKANGEGLFHWIFSKRDNDSINGYTKSIWGGVTTLELAKFIDTAISKNITGLYQLSNSIGISKYKLLRLIVDAYSLPLRVDETPGIVCDKSIIQSYKKDFKYNVPDYPAMISELYDFMIENKAVYNQYWSK
jgi:dTDP-4-dehydrorhamnose reductase